MASKSVWIVGAEHEAFGEEGARQYFGSRLGAQRAANRIARRGGHGWRPFITFASTDAIARDERRVGA